MTATLSEVIASLKENLSRAIAKKKEGAAEVKAARTAIKAARREFVDALRGPSKKAGVTKSAKKKPARLSEEIATATQGGKTKSSVTA